MIPNLTNVTNNISHGSFSFQMGYRLLPESEERFFREASAGGGDCHDESGDSEGGVDWDEAGPERGSGRFAAEQQQEAEEANHELKKKMTFSDFFENRKVIFSYGINGYPNSEESQSSNLISE